MFLLTTQAWPALLALWVGLPAPPPQPTPRLARATLTCLLKEGVDNSPLSLLHCQVFPLKLFSLAHNYAVISQVRPRSPSSEHPISQLSFQNKASD